MTYPTYCKSFLQFNTVKQRVFYMYDIVPYSISTTLSWCALNSGSYRGMSSDHCSRSCMFRTRAIIKEPTPLPDTKLLVVLRSGKHLHSYNTIMETEKE